MKFLITLYFTAAVFLLYGAEKYHFFLVSDTHLGAAETYCTDPAAPPRSRTKKDIHRADKVMHLYNDVFADIAKKSDKNSFVIEAGDLIEGFTHNKDVHKKVLSDAINLMTRHIKTPIYMICGNHEFVGIGGMEAYKETFLPAAAKLAGREKLENTNYFMNYGKDLYVFADYFPTPNRFAFLKKVLQEQKTKPRYVFFIIHAPPMYDWNFGEDAILLFELLAEYNGIILAGHNHQNTVTKFEKNGKAVRQVTVSTSIFDGNIRRNWIIQSSQDLEYFKKSVILKAKRRKVFSFIPVFEKQWCPFLTEYKKFNGTGYAKFDISDDGVSVSFQSADLTRKPVTLQLLKNNHKQLTK